MPIDDQDIAETSTEEVADRNSLPRRPRYRRLSILLILAVALLLVGVTGLLPDRRVAIAEFADVIINNYSDKAGMRPVVFPHWFHRIRFRCKICHADLGFEFKAGGNDINMLKIFDGEYCGACHNGQVAWGVENCVLCHSGKPGLRTHVHNSTTDRLVVPVDPTTKK
jgi:c(7)-type cytochrome triheme protein